MDGNASHQEAARSGRSFEHAYLVFGDFRQEGQQISGTGTTAPEKQELWPANLMR